MHILVLDTQLIHFVDQNGHKDKTVGHTCRIIADKSNLLSRFDQFVDWRTADRMIDGI